MWLLPFAMAAAAARAAAAAAAMDACMASAGAAVALPAPASAPACAACSLAVSGKALAPVATPEASSMLRSSGGVRVSNNRQQRRHAGLRRAASALTGRVNEHPWP